MSAFEDSVRPYQLPTNAPGQLYLSQYNLTSQPPILTTPGFGGATPNNLPPITMGSASSSIQISYYVDQQANEISATEQ